jgi:predicted DNA-binding protein
MRRVLKSIRLDPYLVEQIDKYAESKGREFSEEVRRAITFYVHNLDLVEEIERTTRFFGRDDADTEQGAA